MVAVMMPLIFASCAVYAARGINCIMPRTGLCRVEAWLRRRQVLPARHNSEGDASAFRHRRRGGDVMRVAPRVPITGPLQPYFDGFVAELEEHGYTDLSAANQHRLRA